MKNGFIAFFAICVLLFSACFLFEKNKEKCDNQNCECEKCDKDCECAGNIVTETAEWETLLQDALKTSLLDAELSPEILAHIMELYGLTPDEPLSQPEPEPKCEGDCKYCINIGKNEHLIVPGFVRIQGGTFIMGSPDDEPERYDDEGPQREITISSFYMGKYQVTQKEYADLERQFPRIIRRGERPHFTGDYLPITNIHWLEALDYCNALSIRDGLTPAYTFNYPSGNHRTATWNRAANGYRLPTEAEWEYAARAGTTTMFYTGNRITTCQANYNGSVRWEDEELEQFREKTVNVGSFAPNAWGLYDMFGNVYEWCWDNYKADHYEESFDPNDPIGPLGNYSNRATRGGDYRSGPRSLRSAFRGSNLFVARVRNVGFRVVRPIQ